MPRKKEYKEEEVLEKAMLLFWRNGYETTSMHMLEKEMGINKFSIYASFGNKHSLFLESLKCYKLKISVIIEKFKNAPNGVQDIKQFFYDSVASDFKGNTQKGCFITNTYTEFSKSEDILIREQMTSFIDQIKEIFIEKLKKDDTKDAETIQKQTNFLLLAKHGLAAASRVNSREEIEDYIEMTFINI
jgi:AcrR family transcriptional regulator|tara:strand:- start:255 stop:818 length:564 start_codon:yes stop_codon:yes gene_type:complete